MFLRLKLLKFNNHSIYPDWRLTSDHTPFTVNIAIFEEYIQTRKYIIVKNSKKEENFISELIKAIKELNIENISNIEVLKQIMQSFPNVTDRIWFKNSKIINVTKYSKKWWNYNCYRDLKNYRSLR